MPFLPALIPVPARIPVARGLALFLALFTLLNLLGTLRFPGFDANAWWIDIGYLPNSITNTGLLLASLSLLAFGIGFPRHFLVRRTLSIVAAVLTAAVSWNVLVFYFLWMIGRIHPGFYLPFSLALSLTFGFILRASWGEWKLPSTPARILFIGTFLVAFILFPLAQMFCFGKTDYRRDADAIIVFGARTYADGTPSQALADRVNTAVTLYKEKRAGLLIVSGGPGDGPTSEPQAMRALAVSQGVPLEAVVLDEEGVSTEATVSNTVPLLRERHVRTVLAVSHFYHLPRIKMSYARALHPAKSGDRPDITVYTVPAQESSTLRQIPFYMAREVAALWAYYLRPLF